MINSSLAFIAFSIVTKSQRLYSSLSRQNDFEDVRDTLALLPEMIHRLAYCFNVFKTALFK